MVHINPMRYSLFEPSGRQREIVLETARRLAPYTDRIMHRWAEAYREADPTHNRAIINEMGLSFKPYFKSLQEGTDAASFYDQIGESARRLCKKNVSFDQLILSLHLMEDSCLPYIKDIYPEKERLVEAMVILDYMCHACFSVMAGAYFHEKYTTTIRPSRGKTAARQLLKTYQLTKRESEVLKRIADGYKNREIAEILKIRVKTVEHHRASLMRKLMAKNVVDLVKFAIRNQLT